MAARHQLEVKLKFKDDYEDYQEDEFGLLIPAYSGIPDFESCHQHPARSCPSSPKHTTKAWRWRLGVAMLVIALVSINI